MLTFILLWFDNITCKIKDNQNETVDIDVKIVAMTHSYTIYNIQCLKHVGTQISRFCVFF